LKGVFQISRTSILLRPVSPMSVAIWLLRFAVTNTLLQFDPGGTCELTFTASIKLGPAAGQSTQGTLSLTIGADGAIDAGSLKLDDGTSLPVVGQAIGRSIRLRAGGDSDTIFTFTGSAENPVDQCSGNISGAFSGPGVQNLGIWAATASQGA
jgi:hypothetical protein